MPPRCAPRFEDGRRLPGTPDRSAFAELVFAPRGAWGGFNAAIEVVHIGRLYVNDANEDFAPAVIAAEPARRVRAAPRRARAASRCVRLDNATDRSYSGSVIVNEAQRRFFEPALPRNWMVGLVLRYRF